MKIRKITISIVIFFMAPFLCIAEGEWKIYPVNYGQVSLPSVNALMPIKEGGILASPWTHLYIIDGDSIEPVSQAGFEPEYFEIYKMQKDSKGVIWVPTQGGLAKYTKDGGFRKVSKLDYGGSWDYILLNGLTIDSGGNLWFFSNTTYITKFDGKKFYDYDFMKLEPPYFNFNNLVAKDSILRYATPAGLCEVTVHAQDSMTYKILPFSELKFTGNTIKCLQFDNLGNIYASSNLNELSFYTNGQWEAINIPDSLKIHNENWNSKYIKRILPINDDQIYIFWAMHDFFCKYDRKTDSWEKIKFPTEHVDTLYSAKYTVEVGSAEFDYEGYLWISTAIHGILRYKPNMEVIEDNHIFDAWIEDLYPNPTRGNILKAKVFLMPDGVDNVEAYVSDIFGNRLIDFSNNFTINPSTGEANLECSLEGLANGAYIFVLKKGSAVRAKNFVKID